ncbi:MAG: Fic family protein, partial [bacterium]|nr:Fic family protein [bacterium]
MKRTTGRYERTIAGGEAVSAFVPSPLPPRDPGIAISDQIAERFQAAKDALARLDVAGELVPSLDWFIYAFVRKEAVITSQIEGTQATLIDLLTFEAEDEATPDADVE